MLGTYFGGFLRRFTTNWNKLEVGIAMGCSVSPILFVLAMQLLLKVTESNAEIDKLDGGLQMPTSEGIHGRHYNPLIYHSQDN